MILVVLGADFKVRTGVLADWTNFRGDIADVDVTTVAAFPDGDFVASKYDIVLNIVKEFEIAGFVFFFNGGNLVKLSGEFVVAFVAGFFGEFLIHIGPFVIFARGSVF